MRHTEARTRTHAGARREYVKRGQSAPRFALLINPARDRREAAWRRQLLEAAGSEAWTKRLWAEVLRDAMAALQGRHPSSRAPGCGSKPETLWREACAWILSRELEPLGTFESVCAVLELDAEAVRRDLCGLAMQKPTLVVVE